ncbi:MAG TPA: right-handed parallel beta-helix repeat-containing protein [Acidobacteriaceae bacterium]
MMQRREFLAHMARAAVAGAAALRVPSAWAATESLTGTMRRASVTDFGADPTGEKDSTTSVQKAIAALAKRNARLVFPAGKYSFAASNAAVMEFDGYEGLEIFGNGAELSFAGATRPLHLSGCKDLEVHDIVVDWTRPPFSQGSVRAVSTRSITVAVDASYPVDGSEPVRAVFGLDGKDKPFTGVRSYSATGAQSSGPQTLEVALGDASLFHEGDRVAVLHPAGDSAALRLDGCEEILLETVVFHTAPAAAVVLSGCRDITLDTVRVMPHPGGGRALSSCGGGIEILDCTGTVSAQHALVNGTGGAGMRVQQSYWQLSQVADPQTALLASGDGKPVPEWLLPEQGAFLQISEPGTLKLLGEIAVAKAEAAPGGMRLSFTETLSPAVGKGTLFCLGATNQAQLKMDDCKFLGGPYAGIVAQSRARIGNCSFSGYAGPAILLAPDLAHMRGPVVENIHVTDCNFTQCNLAPGDERGAITIDTQPDRMRATTPKSRINEGITLQRNVFFQTGGPGIYCAGATWVDIESNRFNHCDMLAPAGETPRAVVLRSVDEGTISGNDGSGPAAIVPIDCTEKVKVGDNGPLTVAPS